MHKIRKMIYHLMKIDSTANMSISFHTPSCQRREEIG